MKKWDISNIAIILGILNWFDYCLYFVSKWGEGMPMNIQFIISDYFVFISIFVAVGSIILNIILFVKESNISDSSAFKLIIGLTLNIIYIIAYFNKMSLLVKL